MSDLHAAILDMKCDTPKDANINQRQSYQFGHQAARYAAAELALESDRRIAELEAALHRIVDMAHDASTGPAVPDTLWDIRCEAYELLKD